MLDISKYAGDERLLQRDPEGHMFGLDSWSPLRAEALAREAGLTLGEDHWKVIYALRERHRREGPAASAREVAAFLEREVASDRGRKWLYELFPDGPVRQASRIAGLPPPSGSEDRSFGSVL